MLIHANEKFTDNGDIYEIVPDFDRSGGITTYTTYLYDEDGILAIAGTNNSQEFPYFYRLGWTKAEVKADIKETWTIVKDKYIHIDDLVGCLDYGIDEWLDRWFNLKTWEKLPTEDAFIGWLCEDFEPIWDEVEENSEDVIFKENNMQLIESVWRIKDAMERDPELVQLTD